jgi:hypothetical protein
MLVMSVPASVPVAYALLDANIATVAKQLMDAMRQWRKGAFDDFDVLGSIFIDRLIANMPQHLVKASGVR